MKGKHICCNHCRPKMCSVCSECYSDIDRLEAEIENLKARLAVMRETIKNALACVRRNGWEEMTKGDIPEMDALRLFLSQTAESIDVWYKARLKKREDVGELAGWNKAVQAQCEFDHEVDPPKWMVFIEVGRWWHPGADVLCQANDILKAKDEWLLECGKEAALRQEADKLENPDPMDDLGGPYP